METSTLCRRPADDGRRYPRCRAIVTPRGRGGPRQCRRAALKGARFCGAHTTMGDRPYGEVPDVPA